MAFNQYYNNLNPYGDATPNRMVFGLDAETDTSITAFEAGLAVNYGMEIIGEGGSDLRSFMVAKGGGLIHLGNLLETCLLYTSPSPRDAHESRMPSSA